MDAQIATQIKDNSRTQAQSYRSRVRIEECRRIIPQEAERLDRRSEVVNEALAEEIQRRSRGRRDSRVTTAASNRERIRPNRGWQERVKRQATDAEPEAQIEVPMEMGIDVSAALSQRFGSKHKMKTCREVSSCGSHHARGN